MDVEVRAVDAVVITEAMVVYAPVDLVEGGAKVPEDEVVMRDVAMTLPLTTTGANPGDEVVDKEDTLSKKTTTEAVMLGEAEVTPGVQQPLIAPPTIEIIFKVNKTREVEAIPGRIYKFEHKLFKQLTKQCVRGERSSSRRGSRAPYNTERIQR